MNLLSALPEVARLACDPEFFDVQSLDQGHVARLRLGGVRFHSRDVEGATHLASSVNVHMLLHAAGFLVLRLTIRPDLISDGLPWGLQDFHRLYDCIWTQPYFTWTILTDSEPRRLRAGVRRVMDWLFFDTHERLLGRPRSPEVIDEWTSHHDSTVGRFVALQARGEVLSPYPVIFGTHYEFLDAKAAEASASPKWLQDFMAGSDHLAADVQDIDCDLDDSQWYVGENKSMVLLSKGRLDDELDAYSPDRTQLIEMMTLRRAALRLVQRATQAAITGRQTITRRQLVEWDRVVAAATDDYVLHDRIGQYIEPLKRHVDSTARVRSLATLEEQVRRNLASFQSQVDAAAGRAQVVVGILFGVVAATALGPLARQVATRLFSVRIGSTGATVVDLIVVAVMACVALVVLRRANRLDPPGSLGGGLGARVRRARRRSA